MGNSDLIYVCEVCQTIVDVHHCRALCQNCGRMFDCDDLALMASNGQFNAQSGRITLRSGSDIRDWLPAAERPRDVDPPEDSNANLP